MFFKFVVAVVRSDDFLRLDLGRSVPGKLAISSLASTASRSILSGFRFSSSRTWARTCVNGQIYSTVYVIIWCVDFNNLDFTLWEFSWPLFYFVFLNLSKKQTMNREIFFENGFFLISDLDHKTVLWIIRYHLSPQFSETYSKGAKNRHSFVSRNIISGNTMKPINRIK